MLRRLMVLTAWLGASIVLAGPACAQEDYLTANLIPNGDLETDDDGDGYPDGWPRSEQASVQAEDGNRFLAVESYGGPNFEIELDPEWVWVEVSCRMRCRGVVHGPEGYHDARMVMSFNDADRQHVDPWPNVLRGEGTFDWRDMKRSFKIPPGAVYLSIGPANFGAGGIADYDDIVIRGKVRPPLRDLPLPVDRRALWTNEGAARRRSSSRDSISLNGLWQFRPVMGDGELSAPPAGEGWGYFKVPGSWNGDPSIDVHIPEHWEDTDLGDTKGAWYRRTIDVPADWAGRRVEVQLDLVQTRADVFVDGKGAGSVLWPGGTLDLTDAVRPGETHEISALVVAAPQDARTQVFMGPGRVFESDAALTYRGLCGDASLQSRPAEARIGDVTVRPSVLGRRIELEVELFLLPEDEQLRLSARVEHAGRTVKEFRTNSFTTANLSERRLTFGSDWADPPLWEVDDPQLCTLHLALTDAAGEVLDEALPIDFGFRDFAIDGRDFRLNGKRIHLRALNVRNASNADWGSLEGARVTFRRLKQYGFNYCIMSNYHFEPGGVNYFRDMLRAADEEGMLVSFSMPHVKDFGWSLEDPARADAYRALTEWLVGQVKHHPSVITYAMNHNSTGYMGDQDPFLLTGKDPGPDNNNRRQALIAQEIVESVDPTRVVYHHQSGNLGSMITLNCYLNWAPIRERSRWLAKWATEGVKPFFFVEWGLPHIASWSSYRGPNFIWRSLELQQVWSHEFAATFKGDDAYEVDESDIKCLEAELHYWDREEPFHYGSMLQYFAARERNVLEIKSMFAAKNWPHHRTWGMSAMLPWDQNDMWKRTEKARQDTVELETDWPAIRRPGVSPDRAKVGDVFIYSRDPDDWWEPTSLGRTFLRYNMPLLAYLGGKAPDFTEDAHTFLPGETVEKQVVFVNDSRDPVAADYEWKLGDVAGGSGTLTVEPGGVGMAPIAADLPADFAAGEYELALTVSFPHDDPQEDSMAIHVLPTPDPPAATGNRIALFDPAGNTTAALESLGITFDKVGADADLDGYDLLIVGREALSVAGPAPDISRVQQGLNVLVFEQTEEVLNSRLGFRTQTYGLRRVFPRVPDHAILDGLAVEHLRDWRGDATLVPPYMDEPGGYNSYPMVQWSGFTNSRVWRCGNGGSVATVLIEKPSRGDFLPVVDGGFDLQYAPILEHKIGAGIIIFCQMDVTARTEKDPAARRLVRNLLKRGAYAEHVPGRSFGYAGGPEGRAALEALGVRLTAARSPSDVLIVGPGGTRPSPEVLKGVSVLLLANGAEELAALDVPVDAETAVVPSSALGASEEAFIFKGLSNAGLHFRDLQETAVVSGVPTADDRGLLAAIRRPRAYVVLCQVAPWMFESAHDRTTFRRVSFMLARILGNLGVEMQTPLVDYWGQPAMRVPSIAGDWKGMHDPDDSGEAADWQAPEFDDADWQPIEVGATFESQRADLADYDGVFWYRTEFDMPVVEEGAELVLIIGAVDDEDRTFLNGVLIGETDPETNPDDHWAAERRYRIPPELLRPTGNVLAVRAKDTYLSGGIVRGPVAIQAPGRWLSSYYVDEPIADDDPYRYYRW